MPELIFKAKSYFIRFNGIFWAILAAGIYFRLVNFPNIPSGLNQDEVASSYEAFSLLTTGSDKWGSQFPAYFSAWGSGQSVLLSYIQIPFIQLFGLNVLAIRLPSVILGILTLPLIYKLTQKWFGTQTARLSMLMAAILPWSTMNSRWGLEANILTFFVVSGLFLTTIILEKIKQNDLKLFDKIIFIFWLFPFGLGLYSYGLSLVPVVLFIIFCLILYRQYFWKYKYLTLGSLAVFGLTAIPISLVILKNNIFGSSLFFEKYLPFSIPLLSSDRLNQINDDRLTTIASNLYFLIAGFPDSISWNNDSVFLPLGLFSFPFLVLGIFYLASKIKFNWRQFQSSSTSILPLIWLISFSPLLFFVPMNTTRANSILYIVMIVSAYGIWELYLQLKNGNFGQKFLNVTIIWIILYGLAFQFNYNILYPKKVAAEFNKDIQKTLLISREKSLPGEQIYLTKEVLINYVFPLFVFQVHPQDFRNNSEIVVDKDGYTVRKFQNFVFDKQYLNLKSGQSWLAILKPCENNWCDRLNTINQNPSCFKHDTLYQDDVWLVARCYVS